MHLALMSPQTILQFVLPPRTKSAFTAFIHCQFFPLMAARSVLSASSASVPLVLSKACSICQEDMTNATIQRALLCAHVFHQQCVEQWLEHNSTCPTCRINIDDPQFLDGALIQRGLLNPQPAEDEKALHQHVPAVVDDLDDDNFFRFMIQLEVQDLQRRQNQQQRRQDQRRQRRPQPFVPQPQAQPQAQIEWLADMPARPLQPAQPPQRRQRRTVDNGCIHALMKPTNPAHQGQRCGRKTQDASPFCGYHSNHH
jgi:hypothetical protein